MTVMAFGASLPRCCCKADEGYNLKTYTCYSLFDGLLPKSDFVVFRDNIVV
jgi:hypothetical protein